MKPISLMWIILITVALLAPTAGFAQVSCTREGLQRAVDLYIAAQTKGDISGLPLPVVKGQSLLGYTENMALAKIDDGLIKKPMKIDFHRSLLDTSTCQTFTEVFVNDKTNPYVLGTRLHINHDKIAEIEIISTTTGDWGFDVAAYLKYASAEKWDTIPAEKRDTRNTLVFAANAYLDAFLEGKKDMVPWGYPCVRTEGGMSTGKGLPTDSCDVGVPDGVNIANRRYVVDETIGAVVALCTFGAGNGAPDSHLFRLENGKLRFVHTLTHLKMASFRGGGAGGGGGFNPGTGTPFGGPGGRGTPPKTP